MRLIFRFAAIYLVVTGLMFVLVAFSAARREQERIVREARTDVEALGSVLAKALSLTYESGGTSALENAFASIARSEADVRLRLHGDQGSREPLARTEGANPMGPTAETLEVRVPIKTGDHMIGELQLSRSLPRGRTLLLHALYGELPIAGLLTLLVSVVAVVVGGALIGKPLQRMVAHANRVGSGDYSSRLRDDRKDEIGDLKRALNTMCEQLDLGRTKLANEAAARLSTLEELRHLDRLRTIGTIASSLAHELGTPLNVLLIRGQALAAGNASDVQRTGEIVVQQVEKMSRIVRQMMNYARKEASSRTRRNLAHVTTETIRLLEGVASKASVTIEGPAPSGAEVSLNRELFEQALTNVLMNAIHALPKGGTVKVRIRREDHATGEDRLTAFDACVVDVEDSGVGIAPENQARLFEPFYTTKEVGRGTGLGLPVAKGIVEEHGGFMRIASEVGVGTTVSIYLPEAT